MLLLALAVQAASPAVPPATQRLGDFAMLVGVCEQYIPRAQRVEITRISETGSPEKQRFIEVMRAKGREMQGTFDERTCRRLLSRR
jgi:hypothetical protein